MSWTENNRIGSKKIFCGIAGLKMPFRTYICFVLLIIFASQSLHASQLVLNGVPTYYWWYGCAPTSGGMLVGFWDGLGYNLVDGDISTFNTAAKNAIATPEHVSDYYNDSYSGGDNPSPHVDNCLADFMDTSVDKAQGATTVSDSGAGVVDGLESFAAWDNPATPGVNESYTFTSTLEWTTVVTPTGTFTFDDIINQINAGNPMILAVNVPGGGHAIVGYGYQDNPGTADDWIAVKDTWNDGTSSGVGAKTESGAEWWKWDVDNSDSYYIYGGVTFIPVSAGAPEPASMILFSLGGLFMLRRKKKS